MPEPTTAAKIASEAERTTCPEKKITKVIVDPGYEGSTSIDLEKRAAGAEKAPPNVRHLDPRERDRVLARLREAQAPAARSVGQAVDTVDGGAHSHQAAVAPSNVVAPPQVRVHFDIPGYASMSFRYHAVKRVPGYLVFVTDTRHAGGADFHPYTSKMGGQGGDKPMGAYVENGKKLYLLQPGSILFRHDPFEFCLVPIAEERPLPSDAGGEQEELTSETATEGQFDGEEGSDRGGAHAPGEVPAREASLVDRLDFTAGGKGGVL
jgi:hypothetical protein